MNGSMLGFVVVQAEKTKERILGFTRIKNVLHTLSAVENMEKMQNILHI